MVLIAGSPVAVGDNLYIHRAQAYGQVIKLLNSNAIVRVSKGDAYRDFTVQTGGVVAGEANGASWFPPIELGLGRAHSSKYAAIAAVVATMLEKI